MVRRENTKGGVEGGKQTNALWKAKAEMQIMNKRRKERKRKVWGGGSAEIDPLVLFFYRT